MVPYGYVPTKDRLNPSWEVWIGVTDYDSDNNPSQFLDRIYLKIALTIYEGSHPTPVINSRLKAIKLF